MNIGINVIPLSSGHKRRGIGYYTNNLLNYLKKDNEIKLSEFTKISEIKDVSLIHYPWFDFYFHTLPIRRKFKTVLTIHDAIPIKFKSHYPIGIKGKLNFELQKFALKSVNAIITDSQTSKKDLMQFLKIKSNIIFVIPLAADEDFVKKPTDTKLIQIRRKYQLPDKFLLYVGDANWIKNLPFLIKGFSELLKKDNLKELSLILVGEVFLKNVENIDHPELESLKAVNRLIKELNLEENIIRPGFIQTEELVGFYNLASVYIQPSIYEGFGLPLLQAFSAGTPVISSNGGSLTEVGGNAAVYFNPNNISQFISITEEVLLSKSLQNKLSNLGLKQSLNFSWEKTANLTKEIYEQVVNS